MNSRPQKVFAFGGLNFYGMHNAEKRGVEIFYSRCYGSELAKADPFAIDLSANEELREMYLEAEKTVDIFVTAVYFPMISLLKIH